MSYTDKIRLLRLYMEELPDSLPDAAPDDNVNKLLDFSLDPGWVTEIGEELTINREIETAFFAFGKRSDEGIFRIPTRGPGIEALADVLACWLPKYPDSFHLNKWLKDATASASAAIIASNKPLPTLLPVIAAAAKAPVPTKKVPAKPSTNAGKQIMLTGEPLKKKKKKTKDQESAAKKPDNKSLPDTSDLSVGDESDEEEDERSGGRKLNSILLKVSKPFRDRNDGKKGVRCLASAGCKQKWAWPRSKQRILKHASGCSWLANINNGDLVAEALTELAARDPTLLNRLNDKFGLSSKRPHDAVEQESSAPIEAPPLKRSKTSASAVVSTPNPAPTDAETSGSQPVAKYRTEGRKILEQKANDALVELFVCCGIAPRIIGREEFKKFVNTLNNNYLPVSRTTFEDSLVPAYAASVRIAVINYLKTSWFLTISFDGGKLSKKKFISVHITTPHRQSFCVDLDDVSRVSQTGEYIAGLIKKIIAELKELLAFMSLSSYSQDWFDDARVELGISRGLQSIGETRFATIYWSLDSVLRGIPAFTRIVRAREYGIDSEILQKHFLDDDDTFKLKRDLTRLGAVLMPFARAIQCLEAKDTTPADVYLYWLAIVAQLNDLITKDDKTGDKSKYATVVKELIRSIANFRFSQLIENESSSNVYFTAFVLDPDNRGAPILATPNPLAVQPVHISVRGTEPAVMQHPPLIKRIGLSLQKILQREYSDEFRPTRTIEEAKAAMREINPYIAHRTPSEALTAFRSQLKHFLDGAEPFDRKKKPIESVRQWWLNLLNREDSDILAALAVKIFSASPVSMPDERGMSTITWINSDTRNRQEVSTVSDHMAIRGFNRMGSDKVNPLHVF
ncbi:ribonuclease H-like domain-containing protein [Mycena latifolia]|nr:ribonuclease H-like domain-containing protein [Mycena latifolia]